MDCTPAKGSSRKLYHIFVNSVFTSGMGATLFPVPFYSANRARFAAKYRRIIASDRQSK